MKLKIELVKHFTFGVFVMIANEAGELNEMTFGYTQEAYDFINAVNKITAKTAGGAA